MTNNILDKNIRKSGIGKKALTVLIGILWVASLIDMILIPACQTDPLFRLLECAFAFILVPLLVLVELEKN